MVGAFNRTDLKMSYFNYVYITNKHTHMKINLTLKLINII